MKKITIGLVTFAALAYSTTALADTPTVRQMNTFDHIQAVSGKNRALTNNASEFVIYHQDGRPCPPHHDKGEKGKHEKHKHEHEHKHEHKKEEGKHHHHHHHKDEAKKKSDGAAKAAPKAAAPAAAPATGENNGGNQ